jgi:hypothetical protein
MAWAVLGGGLGVPCTGNPRHAGLISRLRPADDRAAPGQPTSKVGSCATRSREPGQARKGAAVSGVPKVPQGGPAGAGFRDSDGRSRVQSGRAAPLSRCAPRVPAPHGGDGARFGKPF